MQEIRLFIGFFVAATMDTTKNTAGLFFAVLSTLLSVEYAASLFGENSPLSHYQALLTDSIESRPALAILFLLALSSSVFAKGAMVAAIGNTSSTIKTAFSESLRVLWKLLSLELGVFLSLIVILVTLLLPATLVPETNPLWRTLGLFGILVFAPIAVIISFIEIYGFFYIVLAKTSLRESVEFGYSLFMKRRATSLVFGTLSLIIIVSVSLLISLAARSFHESIPESTFGDTAVAAFLLLSQAAILFIQKSAWVSFFRFIGTETKKEEVSETSQEEKNVLQKEIPEVG